MSVYVWDHDYFLKKNPIHNRRCVDCNNLFNAAMEPKLPGCRLRWQCAACVQANGLKDFQDEPVYIRKKPKSLPHVLDVLGIKDGDLQEITSLGRYRRPKV